MHNFKGKTSEFWIGSNTSQNNWERATNDSKSSGMSTKQLKDHFAANYKEDWIKKKEYFRGWIFLLKMGSWWKTV